MSEVGPFGFQRARYFVERHEANLARRERAALALEILRGNLGLEQQKLSDLQHSVADPTQAESGSVELRRAEEQQRRYLDDIRSEVERTRGAVRVTSADRLVAWAVEHDARRPPEPGEYLLARRSKKPF